MAYNKTKYVENAQKFLHQGKISQAIAEYQQILKQEPKDQITLMTVGDLYVRGGETFQALEYFERLAQIFLAEGFVSKAIAVYKKIAKLAPEETRPVERLAELYVQQGVLSEARPIYLQLAELHQRAGRQPQAIALLRKLLEAEPDNLRVQTRLAELSIAINQPADAVVAYRAAAEQLHVRGDHDEAVKYADRALKIDSNDVPTITLKARVLAASGHRAKAVALIESLPQIEAGGVAPSLLLDLYLESGEAGHACELAAKIFARDPKKFAPAHEVAAKLLEAGEPNRALTLLDLIREAMTDAGEHEALSQSLTRATERLPGNIEPRQWLVDLYARTSDSFRLPDALVSLAEACEAAGKHDQARQVYEQLLDRDPENEAVRRKFERLGARTIAGNAPSEAPQPPPVRPERPAAPATVEPQFSEETLQFVAQALTDVDLFSSYGLTQKAIDLLEVVLQRAPGHTATLERLLDFYLGAGDERRTAELAAQLEQIHGQRGETSAADRFAELRRRFERAADRTDEAVAASAPPASTPEFSVPIVDAEPAPDPIPEPVLALAPQSGLDNGTIGEAVAPESAVHEVDLSEEWAALSSQITEMMPSTTAETAVDLPAPSMETEVAPRQAEPEPLPATADETEPEPTQELPTVEASQGTTALAEPETAALPDGVLGEVLDEAPTDAPQEYVLEIDTAPVNGTPATAVMTADDFLESLSSEVLDVAPLALVASEPSAPPDQKDLDEPVLAVNLAESSSQEAVPRGSSGPLGDVFDEFRADMGETADEDEDLETHYNLGSRVSGDGTCPRRRSANFQKVAKSKNNGQVFRYSMQCHTLLGLAFMDKGEPAIAAMWYERALLTPGLDQESILALRYDLGVAQEMAGDMAAARKSFSQVYGMNIDYRDVAERLASPWESDHRALVVTRNASFGSLSMLIPVLSWVCSLCCFPGSGCGIRIIS